MAAPRESSCVCAGGARYIGADRNPVTSSKKGDGFLPARLAALLRDLIHHALVDFRVDLLGKLVPHRLDGSTHAGALGGCDFIDLQTLAGHRLLRRHGLVACDLALEAARFD